MKKELESEAEKFYPIKTDDLICSPKLVRDAYIVGATSKWVEKQKLEFAIDQLNEIKSKMICNAICCTNYTCITRKNRSWNNS